MKRIVVNITMSFFVLTCIVGCGRFVSFYDLVLAEVGDAKLFKSDLISVTASATSSADSTRIANQYVKDWVYRQIKTQEAEAIWGRNDDDIKFLLDEYRTSLLGYKLDKYYVDRNLDTLITEDMITTYFDEHKSQFVLDRTVVEGRIVRFPSSYRQSASLLTLMRSSDPEKQKDFRDICRKNNFELHEFNTWIDFDEFLSYLPVRSNRNNEYDYMLEEDEINTLSDRDNKYYYQITSYLKAGSYAPFENVDDAIRKIIYNQRRNEVIKAYEDSIYNERLRKKEITINVNIDE